MKVLVINCGSSSLKYQLIDMANEEVLAKGNYERIGQENSFLTHKVNGEKYVLENPVPSHKEALEFMLKQLLSSEYGVITSLDEISAIGHRVPHGTDIFDKSVLITDEVIKEIAILSDGGMRDAIGLLDQLSLYEDKNLSISDLYQLSGTLSVSNEVEFLKQYFNENITYCLDQLSSFENDGKNFGKITDDFLYILEKIMKYKVIPDYNNNDDLNFKSEYIELANNVSKEKLYSLISKISDMIKNIKNTSNPRILLEMIFLMEYGDNSEEVRTEKPKEKSINLKSDKIKEEKTIIDKKKDIPKESNNEKVEANKIIESKFKDFSLSLEQVETIKNIRINNALALANKELLLEFKNKLPLILEYMFDENYSSIVCNLQDHSLRVASNENIILSVEYSSTAQILNEKIYLLDELLSIVLSRNIKSIVVTNDEWNNIKTTYVNSKRNNIEYTLMDEEDYYITTKNNKKSENSDLEGIFGNGIDDIIEVR